MRHLPGGIQAWKSAGGPVETGPRSAARTAERAAAPGRDPRRLVDRAIDWGERATFGALLRLWLAIVVGFGVLYWLVAVVLGPELIEGGHPIAGDGHGFLASLYFSFVSATSIGFGDVVPVGLARVLAIVESAATLLLFGAVVSKLVSRRQEELIAEIHEIAFDDRLDRVRTNLHHVLGELQDLAADLDAGGLASQRRIDRLETASLVFVGELRAVHDLLHRPRRTPEEDVLEGILASVARGLDEFRGLVARGAGTAELSPALRASVRTMQRLAGEICGECVPTEHAAHLKVWMDRVQEGAGRLIAGAGRT